VLAAASGVLNGNCFVSCVTAPVGNVVTATKNVCLDEEPISAQKPAPNEQ